MQRKCTACGTWNTNEDHCTNCNELLSPEIIADNREQKIQEKNQALKEKEANSASAKFIHSWRTSKIAPLRWLFLLFNGIWMIFMAIVGFALYFVVGASG